MLANIGTTELLIIAAVIFVLFGGSKLKELARGLGESTKEVKKISKELQGDDEKKNRHDDTSLEDM